MNKSKIVQQIRRLAIASDSFQQCLSVLKHIEDLGISNESDLYPPLIAGVVVTYSKNFNQADGLGPLPKIFSKFPDEELRIAHEKVIDARNTLYAHRDVSAHSFNNSEGGISQYPVNVRISEDNTAFLFQPHLVDISSRRIPHIRSLIQFQMERLQEDLDAKVDLTVDSNKSYKQGVEYLLGHDFP